MKYDGVAAEAGTGSTVRPMAIDDTMDSNDQLLEPERALLAALATVRAALQEDVLVQLRQIQKNYSDASDLAPLSKDVQALIKALDAKRDAIYEQPLHRCIETAEAQWQVALHTLDAAPLAAVIPALEVAWRTARDAAYGSPAVRQHLAALYEHCQQARDSIAAAQPAIEAWRMLTAQPDSPLEERYRVYLALSSQIPAASWLQAEADTLEAQMVALWNEQSTDLIAQADVLLDTTRRISRNELDAWVEAQTALCEYLGLLPAHYRQPSLDQFAQMHPALEAYWSQQVRQDEALHAAMTDDLEALDHLFIQLGRGSIAAQPDLLHAAYMHLDACMSRLVQHAHLAEDLHEQAALQQSRYVACWHILYEQCCADWQSEDAADYLWVLDTLADCTVPDERMQERTAHLPGREALIRTHLDSKERRLRPAEGHLAQAASLLPVDDPWLTEARTRLAEQQSILASCKQEAAGLLKQRRLTSARQLIGEAIETIACDDDAAQQLRQDIEAALSQADQLARDAKEAENDSLPGALTRWLMVMNAHADGGYQEHVRDLVCRCVAQAQTQFEQVCSELATRAAPDWGAFMEYFSYLNDTVVPSVTSSLAAVPVDDATASLLHQLEDASKLLNKYRQAFRQLSELMEGYHTGRRRQAEWEHDAPQMMADLATAQAHIADYTATPQLAVAIHKSYTSICNFYRISNI